MDNILISFIIPVYNVEKYLQECINSITCQWNEKCEMILVDDGSTDKSGIICDENTNEQIKVIHKENGGLSSARNEGIKRSKGKYLAFIDSDDRVANGSIIKLIIWAQNNDIDYCFMQGVKFYPNGHAEDLGDDIHKADISNKSKKEVIECLTKKAKYPGSACTKIYNKSFLEKNSIVFPLDKRRSEDLGFTLKCIIKAQMYDVLDFPYYEYRQSRKNSITNSISIKSVEGIEAFIKDSCKILTKERRELNYYSKCLMGFVAYEYSIMLLCGAYCQEKEKDFAYEILKKYKWVLRYARTRNIIAVRVLCSLLGIKLTQRFLKTFKNL